MTSLESIMKLLKYLPIHKAVYSMSLHFHPDIMFIPKEGMKGFSCIKSSFSRTMTSAIRAVFAAHYSVT